MTGTARAAVQVGPSQVEMTEIELPAIAADEALIEVEACGICGSDIELYRAEAEYFVGRRKAEYPVIRGHEPVGVITEAGPQFLAARGLRLGDRVAVGTVRPCGVCDACLDGRSRRCTGWGQAPKSYGDTPVTVAPGLWGGFATHIFLSRHAVVIRVPAELTGTFATLYNPFGAGIAWGVDLAGTRAGSKVAVLGAGQRGVACALSALWAGAEAVLVTGLARDRHKLEIAASLGLTRTVDVESEDLAGASRELFGPAGPDIVIDTTSHSVAPVADAITMVRDDGTIVLTGFKMKPVPDLPVDIIIRKGLTVRGAYGVTIDAQARAIDLIASGRFDLARLQTHQYPIDQLDRAIATLAGEVPGEQALNVVVTPA